MVVLPVSPAYTREFLTLSEWQDFEEMLTVVQGSISKVHLVRLDQLKLLNSNEYFWDLVHMNSYGQKIATDAFLSKLREFRSLP